jgi:Lon-like protease
VSLFTEDPETESHARANGRRVGWLLLAFTALGVFGMAILPSPYVIESPGPVFDTLGSVTVEGQEVSLITIPREPTYATEGSLSLLTVNVLGNPEARPSWFQIARAWLDPTQSVVPVDSVFPPGVTTEQRREQSRLDMENSQQEAIAAALRAIGEPYESTLVVVGAQEGGPSDGILRADDEIVSVTGVPVRDVTALRAAIAANGTQTPVALGIVRDGAELFFDITPQWSEGSDPVPIIGILVAGKYEFPFEVDIELENVGGPSAGMMFALGIIDKLTPGSLAGGADVAGTGTIAADGTIGPIGGVVQKMYGATNAGADVFLSPARNCAELADRIPDDLEVFSVATLDEAIRVLQTVANDGDLTQLARCTSP